MHGIQPYLSGCPALSNSGSYIHGPVMTYYGQGFVSDVHYGCTSSLAWNWFCVGLLDELRNARKISQYHVSGQNWVSGELESDGLAVGADIVLKEVVAPSLSSARSSTSWTRQYSME